jgi:hypothetical protein
MRFEKKSSTLKNDLDYNNSGVVGIHSKVVGLDPGLFSKAIL